MTRFKYFAENAKKVEAANALPNQHAVYTKFSPVIAFSLFS